MSFDELIAELSRLVLLETIMRKIKCKNTKRTIDLVSRSDIPFWGV